MKEIYIGNNRNSMIKTIQLDKKYNSDSILFLKSHSFDDKFDYEINDDQLIIKRIDFPNVDIIDDNDFHDTIDIGTCETHIKIIKLYRNYAHNAAIKIENHIWPDRFLFKIYNTILIVIRIDRKEGWNYFHKAKIHQGWNNELIGYIYEKNIFHINIGTNFDSSEKKIKLDGYYPSGCLICTENHHYNDRFLLYFFDNYLTIKRYDHNQGWRYDHNIFIKRNFMPKNLLQTHHSNLPHNVKNKLDIRARDWNYHFFKDEDILLFMKYNPIPDFPNIIEKFNNIRTGQHKADLFRYYYLYLKGGVFLDSDAMIEKNLDDIIVNYDFVTAICRDPSLYFNGFIATMPNNIIMYDCIKEIYNCNINELNNDYFRIVRDFKMITDKYKDTMKYKLYIEKGDWNGIMPTVDPDNNDQIIFKHYYGSKVVPE